jgi:hypothetical protein
MIEQLKRYAMHKKKFLRESSDIIDDDDKITEYLIQIVHVYTIFLCVIYIEFFHNPLKLNTVLLP